MLRGKITEMRETIKLRDKSVKKQTEQEKEYLNDESMRRRYEAI